MADDSDRTDASAYRRPDGTFSGATPWGFKKGQSGNPGGRPVGFRAPSERLQAKYGTEEGWQELVDLLGKIKSPKTAVALLRIIVGNDHSLKATAALEGGVDAVRKLVRLKDDEEQKEVEAGDAEGN